METHRPIRPVSAVPFGSVASPRGTSGGSFLSAGDEPDGGGRWDESRRKVLHLVSVPTAIVVALMALRATGSLSLAVLAATAALGFSVVAAMPVRIALLLVAAVPVTSGLRRGLPIPGLRLSEFLIVAGAVVVLALPMQRRHRWSGLDWAALAYTLAGVLLPLADFVVIRAQAPDAPTLQTLAGPCQFLLIYRIAADALRAPAAQRVALRLLLLAGGVVGLLAIAEAVGPAVVHDTLVSITGSGAYATPGYDSVLRAGAVFPMWLALAGYLLVPLMVGVSLLLARAFDVLGRWPLITVLVVDALAMSATLTVATSVAFVLGAVYLGWRYRRLGRVLAVLALTGALAWSIFATLIVARIDSQQVAATTKTVGPSWLPQTIGYRLAVWDSQYLPVVTRYAATGYGPDLPADVTWAHTESGYLTLLLRGGLPYLFSAGVLIVVVVNRARRESEAADTPARMALCEAAAVLAVLQVPINLVFPYLINSGMPQPLWMVWGMLAAHEVPELVRVRVVNQGGQR